MKHWTKPGRRAAAAALATATLVAGCTRRLPPPPPPPPGGGAFEVEAVATQGRAPDTRPWFCNGVGTGTPPSGHGNGHTVAPQYQGKTKGPLSWTDCLAMAKQLDRTAAATKGLETRAKAERAGWFDVGAGYIPGLGTHHITLGGFAPSGQFDPAKPTNIIFGGTTPDAPLVGVAFSHFGSEPPKVDYAGGNDWWHFHGNICNGVKLVPGDDLNKEECEARGGTFVPQTSGVWLLHVWLYPPWEYRPDLFVSGHTCLAATAALPQSDPCWTTAHRDPSLGAPTPPADPGHGNHGH